MTQAANLSRGNVGDLIATTPDQIREIACELRDAMAGIQALIERETAFLRVGSLTESAALAAAKADASRRYTLAVSRAREYREHLQRLLPSTLDALHKQHAVFQAALQINLTVVATVNSVSESVVRNVNAEVQRRAMPQGYTRGGDRASPAPRHAQPVIVSRTM